MSLNTITQPSVDVDVDLVRTPFSESLDDETKSTVANAIWGFDLEDTDRLIRLAYYFDYYIDETTSTVVRTAKRDAVKTPIRSHAELVCFIHLLKQHPAKTRKDIKLAWQVSDASSRLNLDAALDLAVRVMFMTSCRSPTAYNIITTGQVFRPVWKEKESLEGFMGRIFPRYELDEGSKSDTIRAQKLKAYYLNDYANIRINWTNNLPDHLALQITGQRKSLCVFRHSGFLEMSSRALAEGDIGIPMAQSLSLGCLPPDLVSETLRTINLLFPENDERSRLLLSKEVQEKHLDPRLLGPFQLFHGYHENPRNIMLPADIKGLFENYPYWGERLYRLWKEADDPTPMTKVEIWSESRKSPRFVYWAGVIALSFALFFGIVASVLGAAQVWISYCSWKGPMKAGCGGRS